MAVFLGYSVNAQFTYNRPGQKDTADGNYIQDPSLQPILVVSLNNNHTFLMWGDSNTYLFGGTIKSIGYVTPYYFATHSGAASIDSATKNTYYNISSGTGQQYAGHLWDDGTNVYIYRNAKIVCGSDATSYALYQIGDARMNAGNTRFDLFGGHEWAIQDIYGSNFWQRHSATGSNFADTVAITLNTDSINFIQGAHDGYFWECLTSTGRGGWMAVPTGDSGVVAGWGANVTHVKPRVIKVDTTQGNSHGARVSTEYQWFHYMSTYTAFLNDTVGGSGGTPQLVTKQVLRTDTANANSFLTGITYMKSWVANHSSSTNYLADTVGGSGAKPVLITKTVLASDTVHSLSFLCGIPFMESWVATHGYTLPTNIGASKFLGTQKTGASQTPTYMNLYAASLATSWDTTFSHSGFATGQVPYVNGTNSITTNADFYYNSSTHGLSVTSNGDQTGTDLINLVNGQYDDNQVGSGTLTTLSGFSFSQENTSSTSPTKSLAGDTISGNQWWPYSYSGAWVPTEMEYCIVKKAGLRPVLEHHWALRKTTSSTWVDYMYRDTNGVMNFPNTNMVNSITADSGLGVTSSSGAVTLVQHVIQPQTDSIQVGLAADSTSGSMILNGRNYLKANDSCASHSRAFTITYSNIRESEDMTIHYMKQTSFNCVITFPNNTTVSQSGYAAWATHTLTLVSTTSGYFDIFINRSGNRYTASVIQYAP